MKTYRIVNRVNDQLLDVTCSWKEANDLMVTLNIIDPSGIFDLISPIRSESQRSIREELDLENSPCDLDRRA